MRFRKFLKFIIPLIGTSSLIVTLPIVLASCSSTQDNVIKPPIIDEGDNENNGNQEQDNQLPPWQPPYGDDADINLPPWQPPYGDDADVSLPPWGEPPSWGEAEEIMPPWGEPSGGWGEANEDLNEKFKDLQTESFPWLSAYNEEIIGYKKRTPNKQVYDSELMNKYGNSGFKYPAFNHDYKMSGPSGSPEDRPNRYFMYSENASYAAQKMDATKLVWAERTPDKKPNSEEYYKYCDGEWIRKEIKAGTFKRHQAANGFFNPEHFILDSTPSCIKEITIATNRGGYNAIGLYAPAGEVISITFDESTWEKMVRNNYKGIEFVINENYYDNKDPNNPEEAEGGLTGKRMPFVRSTFVVDLENRTFKIGSPYGGSIGFYINETLFDDGIQQSIKFTVEGGIQELHYADGLTTLENWNQQIKDVKANKITAPMFSVISEFTSAHMEFYDDNQVGSTHLDNTSYPKEKVKKWNDFFIMGSYFTSSDINGRTKRESMRFYDDIYGGAAAWGTAFFLLAPVDWGVTSFLSPKSSFTLGNWGMLHEINHANDHGTWGFSKRSHPLTNVATATALSMILDTGRYRSEENPTGEWGAENAWGRMQGGYASNKYHADKTNLSDGEYGIYAGLLYTFGTHMFLNYIRNDEKLHKSERASGMEEIKSISDNMKHNMYPALANYSRIWVDGWPKTEQEANPTDKKVIDELKKYPAIDFVGNLYASGQYVWDYEQQKYNYSNDTVAPYEIFIDEDYVFDFEKGINSTNKSFDWTLESFDEVSKLGAQIVRDPSNPKKLIYKSNKEHMGQVDEFDILIKPTNFEGKPENYVPGYKWKIKVRQVPNRIQYTEYNQAPYQEDIAEIIKNIDSYNKVESKLTTQLINQWEYTPEDIHGKKLVNLKFIYVAPETKKYKFRGKWDDKILLKVNGQEVFKENAWTPGHKDMVEYNFTKGEEYEIDLYVYNNNGVGGYEFGLYDGNQELSLYDNIVCPNINELTGLNLSYSDYIHDERFEYQKRFLSYDGMKQFSPWYYPTIGLSNVNVIDNKKIIKSVTKLSDKGNNLDRLFDGNMNESSETWAGRDNPELIIKFRVEFNEKIDVSSISFFNRWNNWTDRRAKHAKITSTIDNQEVVVMDKDYGIDFDDRYSNETRMNFDKKVKTDNLTIELKALSADSGGEACITINEIQFQNSPILKIDNFYSILTSKIKWLGEVDILSNHNSHNSYNKRNDEEDYFSNLGYYAKIQGKESEFNFKFTGTGFTLRGKRKLDNPLIDIYVDGKLFARNVDISGDESDGTNLYMLNDLEYGQHTIKIMTKNDSTLFLEAIGLLGKNAVMLPWK